MSDPLREFIVGQGLATDPDRPGARTPRLTATGGIPIRATAFFESLGVPAYSQFEQLKPELQARLAELQPAVLRLGPKFNYTRLLEIAEENQDKLDPQTFFKLMGTATLGLNAQITRQAQASKEGVLIAANEFARQATSLTQLIPGMPDFPAIPEATLENLTIGPQGVAVAKAVGGIAGIFVSGKLVVSALSKTTLLPKVGTVIEQLPARTKEILLGIGTGAVLDASRPDGLPADPAAIDLSARLAHPIADVLGGGEAAERVALGLSGGVVGGAIGAALIPIFRGIQNVREARIANALDDATIDLMRTKLQEIGVAVESGATKQAVVSKMFANLDKISQSERLAMISAADDTRLEFVLNQLYTDPQFQGSDDLRYMAGVMRANPGGVNIVRGVKDPKAAQALAHNLGLNVVSMRVKDDILLLRPQVVFPERGVMTAKIQKQVDDFVDQVRSASHGKPSNRLSVLSDGTIVKGDYTAAEMVARYKLKAPIIEGQPNNDIALREYFGMVDVKVGEGGVVTVQLPSTITRRQATALGRMADRGVPEMRFVSALKETVEPGPPPPTVPPPAPTPTKPPVTSPSGAPIGSDVSGMTMAEIEAELRRAKTKVAMLKIDASHGPASAEGVRVEMEHWSNYVKDLLRQSERLEGGAAPMGEYAPHARGAIYSMMRRTPGSPGSVADVGTGRPPWWAGMGHEPKLPRGFYYEKVRVPVPGTDQYMDNYVLFGPPLKGGPYLGPPDYTARPVRWGNGVSPNEALQQAVDRGMPLSGLRSAVIPGEATGSATPALVNKQLVLQNPFGMQVEDVLGALVRGASKPKITADMVKRAQQFQREGVFRGQAGVLPDGYPVEILRRIGNKIAYKDPITGKIHRISRDNIAELPTSLEGEMLPSRQIYEAMDDAEKALFAKLRRGINEGLAKPIATLRDLESFAASRGRLVSSLGKGRVRVFDPNTGESKIFDNLKAATASVRGSLGPLPDLTPPEIEQLLGFKPNFGGFSGGPPARFGEPIPITEDEFAKAAEAGTLGMLPPGAVEEFFTPTRGLMINLSQRYNMPFDKVFANLQSGVVHRQNFVAAWIEGKGPGLPEGVKPLLQIYKMAGKPNEARQRLMTAWLEAESDDIARKAIEKELTSAEMTGVQELRKWYGTGPQNGLFKALDVEAEWLTDYAPHLREQAEGFGNNLREAWRVSRGTPLPKSVDFFADFARDGSLNIYEDRAFVAAARYAEAGARARYLNSAMDDAKRLLRAVPDNAVKQPLSFYLEALRGSEFSSQRGAMQASFTNLLRTLGANEAMARDVGERMTMALLGLSYQATMAFRPGLAIRNAAQIFQTGWPLLGRADGLFAEAIGRALTKVGRDEAILAGAVSVKQNAMFAGDEAMAALPGWLQKSGDLGFKLYDGADVFTRSVTFHAGKLRANKAIAEFGDAIKGGKNIQEAQRALIRDSGAMVLQKSFVDEFLRRVATSPDDAATFIGKQMADITQFLYGRGNQPRWMRSVPGRFLGQFGTWPLWYVDYVKRSFTNMWRNGYQPEAMRFIGKIALVDLAIYEAGKQINLDLRRWMAGNAMFGLPPFGQPPMVNLLYGVSQLSRGLSEAVLGTYDSPANKQRLANARRTIETSGQAFIPNFYAVRDIGRLMNASSPTEVLSVMLATRPSSEYTLQQKLDLLFDPGKTSSDLDLEAQGEVVPTAVDLMLKGMSVQRDRIIVPQGNLPAQPPGATPPPTPQPASSSVRIKGTKAEGGQLMSPSALPKSIRTGESTPNFP